MNIRQTIVPKKTGGNTIVNYGFSSTTNNSGSGGNTTINTNNLSVTNLNADTINTSYITASQINASNATITNQLTTNNLQVNNDLHVDGNTYMNSAYFNTLTGIGEDPTITTDYLDVQVQALIEYLVSNGGILNGRTLFDELVGKEGGTSSITTDYLTVLKSAHFFELIIDKIKAAGGSLILTPADGFTIEKVVDNENDYTLFWKATDGEKKRVNMWEAGDQALCQAFNKGVNTAGNYTDVQTKYYWSLVTAAGVWTAGGNEPVEVEYPDGSSEISNYITISKSDIAQGCVLNPEIGDDIVMLGNRNIAQAGKLNRGTAIYIAAYNSIDPGITAPCFATYSGIDDFDLPGPNGDHRINKIDMNGTSFKGTFITTGGSVLDGTSFTIVPNASNIIRLTSGGTTTISPSGLGLFFLYDVGNGMVYNSILPQACKVVYTLEHTNSTDAPVTIDTPNYDCNANTININYSDLESITLQLYRNVDGSWILKDTVVMNVSDMANLTDGKNGSYTQYAYKNASISLTQAEREALRPQTSDSTYPPDETWSTTPTQPTTGNATYMTQRTVSYNQNNQVSYGAWTTPIRLTGDNGKDGEDGKSLEFIYYRTRTYSVPDIYQTRQDIEDAGFDYTKLSSYTYFGPGPSYLIVGWQAGSGGTMSYSYLPDYLPPSAINDDGNSSYFMTEWTDNPRGVDSSYLYEWVSQRYTTYNGVWDLFTPPVVWAKYGEKGQDGDGVEYIFKHFTTEQTWSQSGNADPANWSANQTDDYTGPTGYKWSDDPVGTDATYKYEYVAQRKKDNGSWQKFGEPSLWSKYAVDGAVGSHIEFRYQNKTTQPTKPSSGSSGLTGGWSSTATTPDFANGEYTWMTQCTVSGSGTYGTWSNAIRITGDNGQKGEDGNMVEFIYYLSSSSTAPSTPASVDTDDYVPSGWSDNPQGVSATYMYEYITTREKTGGHWGNFETPALWAKWGEKGEDGDGVKYIFAKNTVANTAPATPNFTWGPSETSKTYSGVTWYDDPISPSENYPVYCSLSTNKTSSGYTTWSSPAIWATWAQPGAAGKDGLTRQILPQDGYDIVEVVPAASQDKYKNVSGTLKTDLRYEVYEVKDGAVTKVTDWTKYRLVMHVYTPSNSDLTSSSVWATDSTSSNKKWTNNGNNIWYITKSNLLTDLYPDESAKQDYYQLIKSANYNNYCPIKLTVDLEYKPTSSSSWQYAGDRIIHNIGMDATGIFTTSDYIMNSVFTDSWTVNGTTYNGISRLTQDVNGLDSKVSLLSDSVDSVEEDISDINQTAKSLTLSVNNLTNTEYGYSEPTSDDHNHFIFQKSSTKPDKPSGASSSSSSWTAPSGWSKTTVALSNSGEYEWCSVSHDTTNSSGQWTGTWTDWTDPVIVAYYDGQKIIASAASSADIKLTKDSISLNVMRQGSWNQVVDPTFSIADTAGTWLENWKKQATNSGGLSSIYWAKASHNMYQGNYSVELAMNYNNSSPYMLKIYQDLYDDTIIREGSQVITSMYVKINSNNSTTQDSDASVIGMDFTTLQIPGSDPPDYVYDVFYTEGNTSGGTDKYPKIYLDGIYADKGTHRGTSPSKEQYGQIKITDNQTWHKMDIIWTVKNEIPLNQLRFGVYGWHKNGVTTNLQPQFYVNLPQVCILDEGGQPLQNNLKRTGIDIEEGQITLAANKVTFTNSAGTVKDKISIDPTTGTLNAENAYISGEIHANLGFGSSKQISSLSFSSGVHNIDPYTEMATMYYQPPTNTISEARYLKLPNPANFEGLELQFFVGTTSGTLGLSQVKIRTDGNQLYIKENNAYDINSSTTVENIRRPYKLYTISGDNTLIYNSLYRFKVIGGKWYHLEGIITGE